MPGGTLTLRLPPVLLQRDPIYPILMARLHAALPGYEFAVDTRPVSRNPHEMLCSEADAALYLPFGPLQPEIERLPILHNTFYLIVSPEHPLTGRSTLALADLAGQQLFYEPLYQEMVDLAVVQPGLPFSAPSWHMVENYECVYNDLLAGRGMFLCPMKYPAFRGMVSAAAAAVAGHLSADPAGRPASRDPTAAGGIHRCIRQPCKAAGEA